VRVEGQLAQKFAGGGVHDPDLEVLDEQDDVGSGVGSADADVVQSAVVAEGDGSGFVDSVVADPVVGVGVAAGAGEGFGHRVVDGGRGRSVRQGPVWPAVVVLVDEGLEEGLEFADGGGLGWLGTQPFLHRLLEPFGLAAGGGVVGARVLLDHVQPPEFVLEGVASAAAAGETDRIDHAVIGQGGGRDAVAGKGLTEGCGDDRSGDAAVRGHRKCVAGAVVEPADDLHLSAGSAVGSGESIVGDVGLPRLVRHRCFEPDVGGLRTFLGLGGDQPGADQVTADRGPGDHRGVVLFEVPGDGVWAGVESDGIQFGAELVDQLDEEAIEGAG